MPRPSRLPGSGLLSMPDVQPEGLRLPKIQSGRGTGSSSTIYVFGYNIEASAVHTRHAVACRTA